MLCFDKRVLASYAKSAKTQPFDTRIAEGLELLSLGRADRDSSASITKRVIGASIVAETMAIHGCLLLSRNSP